MVVKDGEYSGEDGWALSPRADRLLRRFVGVRTVEDYLDVIYLLMGGSNPVLPPPLPAVALHLALDALDAIWRLHAVNDRKPLLRLTSAERTARLADDVTSTDQLGARLGELTDILQKFDVPGMSKSHALSNLRDLARSRMSGIAGERVLAAIGDLDRIRQLRNGLAHSGRAQADGYRAAAELGLAWPPDSPSASWSQVVGMAVNALSTLRQEFDLADTASDGAPGPS